MRPAYIPQELASLKRWVSRGGNDGKRPFGKCNDPSTWKTLDEALRERGGSVSFALSIEDDLVAVDLDDCLADGVLHPRARELVDLLPSYTEISMSGRGLHVFGRAALPFSGKKKGGLEIYSSGKFVALSGVVFENRREIRNIQEGIDQIIAAYFPAPKVSAPLVFRRHSPGDISEENLILKIEMSRQGEKFRRLMAGDIAGYESRSSADYALLSILNWWTGGDELLMESVFRQSGLMRPKWDRRDSQHGTYGARCIRKVTGR